MKGLGDLFSTSWPLLEYTLQGVELQQARSKDTRSKKHLPITPVILRKLREYWGREASNQDHIMLWAACCTCFYGILHSGEVTISSSEEYDPECHLSVEDVDLDSYSEPSVVRVHIKASKTDLFYQGVFIYLGKTGNDLCPVAAVTGYLAARG